MSRNEEGYLTPDEDFPLPSPKRRRQSTEEDEVRKSVFVAPSRITKTAQRNSTSLGKERVIPDSILASKTTDSDFASLKVAPWLVHSLRSMQIHSPTKIQRTCIPEILKGRDCIGGSRTGTGKTVAFAVPILQRWSEDPFGIYAVVLTPTRELALQIYEQFTALGAPQSLKTVLITGGSELRPQAIALSKRPHIVVATPGRLADHIRNSGEETIIGLKRTKVVVFDEADRLLSASAGMLPDINTCLSILPPSSERLTLLFTATVTPEVRALKSQPRPANRPPLFISEIEDVDNLAMNTSSAPNTTTSSAASLIPSTLQQTYLQVPLAQKDAFLHVLLTHLTTTLPDQNIIVFTNRTTTSDLLHRTLLKLSHPCTALHSGLPQTQRNKNLSQFRSLSPKHTILICTDVASRGLDIPAVSTVINYDIPRDPVDYIHRVGRTARAGRKGTSITFVSQRDVNLVLAIEEYVGGSDENGKGGKKMVEWVEDGVNLETRVVKGRTLKDVGEARMEALRQTESGMDVNGYRRKIKKDRKGVSS